MWYRAHIVRKVDNESGNGVHVELVDFGNRFTVYDEIKLVFRKTYEMDQTIYKPNIELI